jgi:uncharacterized DUF497 family protein
VDFEFNELKSRANAEKHGIDFVDAQEPWLDPMRIEIPARTQAEPRMLVMDSSAVSTGLPSSRIAAREPDSSRYVDLATKR